MLKLEYRKLSSPEIDDLLKETPKWMVKEAELTRSVEFDTYPLGALFALAVAHVANQLDHHPKIVLDYKKVEISVSTHSTGGLSPYDFELARQIDNLTDSR